MKYDDENEISRIASFSEVLRTNLRTDCRNCFGFCCVALYFSASEGFPENKKAGKPCVNLNQDFSCRVHENLGELGFKGCTSYDCFGAGQRVAGITYGGQDWRKAPESSRQMYEVFQVMQQIHEMLWYLTEAIMREQAFRMRDELKSMLEETEKLAMLGPEELLTLDVGAHRAKVGPLLQKTSELVRAKYRESGKAASVGKKSSGRGLDLIGKDLRKANLRGESLRGALLIASNLRGADLRGTDFLGADLRDADLRGANLSESIFLTQAQVNPAKGDSQTKLPLALERPGSWIK